MRAGLLRHRVTVQRRTPPTNDGGVPVPAEPMVLYSRISAEVQTAAAGQMERVFGSQVQSLATHLVRMRFVNLRMTDEIVWHDGAVDRVMRIAGRQDDWLKRELTLAVQEQVQ